MIVSSSKRVGYKTPTPASPPEDMAELVRALALDSVALFDPHASGWFLSGGLKNLDSDAEMLSLSGTGDADKILRLNLITVMSASLG